MWKRTVRSTCLDRLRRGECAALCRHLPPLAVIHPALSADPVGARNGRGAGRVSHARGSARANRAAVRHGRVHARSPGAHFRPPRGRTALQHKQPLKLELVAHALLVHRTRSEIWLQCCTGQLRDAPCVDTTTAAHTEVSCAMQENRAIVFNCVHGDVGENGELQKDSARSGRLLHRLQARCIERMSEQKGHCRRSGGACTRCCQFRLCHEFEVTGRCLVNIWLSHMSRCDVKLSLFLVDEIAAHRWFGTWFAN